MKFSRLALKALALMALSSFVLDRVSLARAEDAEDADDPVVETAETTTETTTESEPYEPPAEAEHFKFEAEVHRMLDIVVNSLYQHNDVFLRELISNASDALDKIRYLLLTDPEQYATAPGSDEIPLEVKIEYDADAKTLTIRDTGVGMTHGEMVQNLGTVARSGTTKFIQALKDSGNSDDTLSQIGQFGVGFYSAFLVADRVTVASKNPTDPVQHVWESINGAAEFVVYDDPRGNTLGRGTEITLHLKEDCLEYTEPNRIKELAHYYSEFVTHPISIRTVETMEVEVDEEEEDEFADEEKKKDSDDELDVSEDDEDTDEEKPRKTKEVTTHSWEQINSNQAIWTRDKEEITDDEYQAFYKQLTAEPHNATEWSHFTAEGNINFKSLLYLPEDTPPSYAMGNMDPVKGAVKLYVRRVLIGDDFELLPRYLGFIRGVVDSDDLQLNVNRETLQESKILTVIRKKVVRKAIDLIKQLAKDSEAEEEAKKDADVGEDEDGAEKKDSKYIAWYKKFAANIKLGILEDYPNQSKLTKLLRFETSKSEGKMIPLSDYTERMKDWQKDIYVLGCATVAECASSPFLEPFKEKDAEVIYMSDTIDEYMAKQLRDFDGKKLVQISSENVKLNDEDEDMIKRREKVYEKKFKPLTKWMRKLYQGTVLRVQVAKRPLGSVPAIVSSSEYGNSANMERIMKAQAFGQSADPMGMKAMRIFEINPRHPLIIKLLDGVPAEDDEDTKASPELADAAWMLHDMAMLNGGFPITNPEAHNKRMLKVMKSQFGLESFKLEPEINPPVEEDEPPEVDMDEEFNFDSINNGQGLPDGITPEEMAKIMKQINSDKETAEKEAEAAADATESSEGASSEGAPDKGATETAENTEKAPEGGMGDEL